MCEGAIRRHVGQRLRLNDRYTQRLSLSLTMVEPFALEVRYEGESHRQSSAGDLKTCQNLSTGVEAQGCSSDRVCYSGQLN